MSISPWSWFCFILTFFGIVHNLLLGLLNPYFTLYGTWYFTPQLMLYSIVLGVATISWARVFARLVSKLAPSHSLLLKHAFVMILISVLIVVNVHWYSGVIKADSRTSMILTFKRAGEWMHTHLPGVQRIATLSSGFVNYFAERHYVINLDGLMNDYRYFYEYLMRNRVPDYLYDEGISYFADYAPLEEWRHGINWGGNVPLSRLGLLRMWIIPDGSHVYAIWRVHPPGIERDILDPCTGPCDRLSQIQFAALVLNRYAVIDDDQLASYCQNHPDAVVVASIWHQVGASLRHVMMSRHEFCSLQLKASELDIVTKVNVVFADSIELLGFDAASWSVARGQEFMFTRYWRVLQAPPKGNFTIDVYIHPNLPGWLWHRDSGAHGTLPLSEWKPGDIIVETYSVPVPIDIKPGLYPVHLGIYSPETGWLPHNGPLDPIRPGMIFVGTLEIR